MSEQDNFESAAEQEPVVIEGQSAAEAADASPTLDAPAAASESSADEAADNELTSGPSALSPKDEAIYTVRLLTAVAIGAVVEGGDQLVTRLKKYEQELQQAQAAAGEEGEVEIDEDEFDRLRYATIGLIFDTQNMIGRSLELTLKATETSLDVAKRVTRPFRNFFLFRPITKRVDKRVDGMVERGQDSLSRWIEIGRQVEPEGRQLAAMTYEEIVDEFISTLADNPELQQLVAQQSISLAAGVRDEVRERTVTSDNVLEDIARRILRRQPRPELAEPPPEVKRWAGVSIDHLRDYEIEQLDEQRSDSAK